MSNDEYKTSLVNYNRFYFGQTTTNHSFSYSSSNKNNKNNNINNHNNSSNSNTNIDRQAVFSAKQSDQNSITSVETPSSQKTIYRTDDVNDNNNNKNSTSNSSNNGNKRDIDFKFMPMNLIRNTGLDLSHSIRKPYTDYFTNESLTQSYSANHNNSSHVSSPSSSTSASIDVENYDNDDSSDRIMSPVSIPSSHQQKPLIPDTRNPSQSAFTNMELTAGSIPSGFPLNYQQLYANNTALYGAPVMFSGAIHAAHASYMAGLPLHAALSPNESYLKAIQAAACGIYSPAALPPPPPPTVTSTVNPSLMSCKPTTMHNNSGSTMALAPTSVPMVMPKSPQQHQQYSPNIANNTTATTTTSSSSSSGGVVGGIMAEVDQQKQDYHTQPLNTQPSLKINGNSNSSDNGTSNSTGTYLNDKVNERVTSIDASKDSHFKVPNGKEGSLKHRILRPSSNSDCTTEPNKTPVMRTYSTTSNFKKGNYIELANGSLRRVEDMRTEDFIQCAERSPHHQLAESTVVKINTSLPSTAVITFSYDRNRSKVDMEVSLDHPFFVYGQGWASCSPESSMKMFGLKCQRLQVGDICISLTKREQPRQPTPPISHATPSTSLPQINEALNYQRRHSLAVSSPNASLKSPSLPAMNSTTEIPYAHAFSIPLPTPNHHLQQQQQHQQQHHHHHHQVQQQAYTEMAKLMSSYAYAKGLPQIPHEQLKEVVMDAAMLQNLPPKVMNAFYQNQIFQFAQQQQEHLRQAELKNNQQQQRASSNSTSMPSAHYNVALHSSHSPQPTDLETNLSPPQHQPPQTQPLDVTMSRKRRWSAPENMFDDDDSDTQPPRNGSSPATARS